MSPLKGEVEDRIIGGFPSSSPPPPNLVSPSKPGTSNGLGSGRTLPPLQSDSGDMGPNGNSHVRNEDRDEEDDNGSGFDLARYVFLLLALAFCPIGVHELILYPGASNLLAHTIDN